MIKNLAFPKDENQYFDLKDSAGLQAFVLVTSALPLPSYKEWKEKAGRLPWQREETADAWGFTGTQYNSLLSPTNTFQTRGGLPSINLSRTLEYIQSNSGAVIVNAVAFPVKERD